MTELVLNIDIGGVGWVLLMGLILTIISYLASAAGEASGGEGENRIEVIEQNLEKLMRYEAALRAKYAQGGISEEEYAHKRKLIEQERKKWEAKLDDSIVAMISTEAQAEDASEEMFDPIAATERRRAEALPGPEAQMKEPEIKVTDIKRGALNEARAFEVKFAFQEKTCKAIISSEEGRWHFRTHGEKFYLIQFISALENSDRFTEVFDKEVQRHPDDWYEVVIKGKTYTENNREKDTRSSFPEICRELIERYQVSLGGAKPAKRAAQKRSSADLSSKAVVIYKVEHGGYTQADKRDFGKGFLEFPRYINVILDWGKYHIKAQLTTDKGQWEVVPRDMSQDYPKKILQELSSVIPFMIQALEEPRNKYLCHTILSEMRKSEHRHQWKEVVRGGAAGHFPRKCRELFQED